jgi:hypothetical protein
MMCMLIYIESKSRRHTMCSTLPSGEPCAWATSRPEKMRRDHSQNNNNNTDASTKVLKIQYMFGRLFGVLTDLASSSPEYI